jgi:hypothetical protein
MWLYKTADELVAILQDLGIIFNVSEAILGITSFI